MVSFFKGPFWQSGKANCVWAYTPAAKSSAESGRGEVNMAPAVVVEGDARRWSSSSSSSSRRHGWVL